MDAGWTPDHGHPISSPCELNGSGELIKNKVASFHFLEIKNKIKSKNRGTRNRCN